MKISRRGRAYAEDGKIVLESVEQHTYEEVEVEEFIRRIEREIEVAKSNLAHTKDRVDVLVEQKNELDKILQEKGRKVEGE